MTEPVKRYHDAVAWFKRELLAQTLAAYGGNRSRAARALGLQRTYLLRLIRDFRVDVPRAADSRQDGRVE
jgi:DNA-binding NtrC family response regulator